MSQVSAQCIGKNRCPVVPGCPVATSFSDPSDPNFYFFGLLLFIVKVPINQLNSSGNKGVPGEAFVPAQIPFSDPSDLNFYFFGLLLFGKLSP